LDESAGDGTHATIAAIAAAEKINESREARAAADLLTPTSSRRS
jgi:hypothetical protein